MDDLGRKWSDMIVERYKPVSVFLYGSRAWGDSVVGSDWELGVLFKKNNYVTSAELRGFVTDMKVLIFPFVYEDFVSLKVNTPFPKVSYYRDLILGGKTLAGEAVLNKMKPPVIKISDLLEVVMFNLGYALAVVHEYRSGAVELAGDHWMKACLYATRALVTLEKHVFPLSYASMVEASQSIDVGEFREVVEQAIKWRLQRREIDEIWFYKNITYLNQYIEPKLKRALSETGDGIVLE